MGRLNHHSVDNGDVEIQPSDLPVEFISESVSDPETTMIKSIDDDEMDHTLEFFHSEHDELFLFIGLLMLQAKLVIAPP